MPPLFNKGVGMRGFSLIELVIVLGLMSAASIFLIRITSNVSDAKLKIKADMELYQFYSISQKLLNSDAVCTASLKSTKPFRNKNAKDGLEFEIWTTDQFGNRLAKKFGKLDYFGKSRIESIKIFFSSKQNFKESNYHSDTAQVKIKIKPHVGHARTYSYFVNVTLKTNSNQVTTITACKTITEAPAPENSGCNPRSSWLCSCGSESYGRNKLRVLTCIHCNGKKQIDDIWVSKVMTTKNSVQCPNYDMIDPPGNDPVSNRYNSNNNYNNWWDQN